MKEYKTFHFNDTPAGRAKMSQTIDGLSAEGWQLKSKEASSQGWDAGATCCLGCLFLPLALLGKKHNVITVIMERDKVEVPAQK